ncbi:hypothetical protein BGX20_007124, partial [Mortierella sp. AD010]
MDLGLSRIETVFEVTYELPPRLAQYVILLKEGGHVCTCLQLRNKGIVCAHFFRAMRHDSRAKYHIQLIPIRWFREDKQDDPSLVAEISDLPFTISTTHGVGVSDTVPTSGFLGNYLEILPPTEDIPKPSKKMPVMTQRFAYMQSVFKGALQELIQRDDTYEYLQHVVNGLIARARSVALEEESVASEKRQLAKLPLKHESKTVVPTEFKDTSSKGGPNKPTSAHDSIPHESNDDDLSDASVHPKSKRM